MYIFAALCFVLFIIALQYQMYVIG